MIKSLRHLAAIALLAAPLAAAPLPAVAQQAATSPARSAASVPVPATATDPAELRRLAAGHRALTLCSAMFNARWLGARRPRSQVEANDLVGVYPELQPYMNDGEVIIAAHHVLVRDRASGERLALAWERGAGQGCSIAKPGASLAEVLRPLALPAPPLLIPAPAQWPAGDLITEFSPHRVLPHRSAAAVRQDNVISYLASPYIEPALSDGPVASAFSPAYGTGTNTTAVVVVRNGDIVAERYAPGFGIDVPQRTWSVAKSIAATIIGAAVYRGEVDVNAPAAIAPWRAEGDPRGAITLDHLLHMASGLGSNSVGNRTDGIYFGGTAVDEEATGWPVVTAPGSTFRYANNDTLLATLAISPTFAQHPPSELFVRLNMYATIAETDWKGNYVLSSQVWTTARDLARFGLLYLNDGVWNRRRILPEGWRTYVSTPSGPQPQGPFGYGASFWLMNRTDGVPADTFFANGNRGQYVVIVPSRNIVIVRRAEDPTGARFDIAAFTRDVLASLANGG
jgi:CubicO group peptidase (beta-lactamase class C family)